VVDWSAYDDAYGPADDMADLLARADASGGEPEWDEVSARLCHQGTVYTASYAAVPVLGEFAARTQSSGSGAPTNPTRALQLAAAIVSSLVPYLLGHATCPTCAHRFDIPGALGR
jgi:hypothetical protein